MQPVPSERSINSASYTETSSASQSPAQHGILEGHEPGSAQPHTREHSRPPVSATSSEADVLSISSGSSSRERLADFRRLSSHDGSPHGFPNFNRIDKYERSSTDNSPRLEPRLFQVIPSKNNSSPRISIDEFPNGVWHNQNT